MARSAGGLRGWIGRYAMMLISEYIIQELKADALADDFCQGIMHYICDKVYKPLGVAERLLQHPEERLTASAVIYSRARQEVLMVGDGGAWTEAQRPYLNHATLLVFILCLSFKARY